MAEAGRDMDRGDGEDKAGGMEAIRGIGSPLIWWMGGVSPAIRCQSRQFLASCLFQRPLGPPFPALFTPPLPLFSLSHEFPSSQGAYTAVFYRICGQWGLTISPSQQSMSELKLRRLMEHNQRLREDLARPRVKVSEASASLIRYCKQTKDHLGAASQGHLPDFGTTSGFVDLLYLAVYMEVQEALSLDSYREVTDVTLLALMRAKKVSPKVALRFGMSRTDHDLRVQSVWGRGRMKYLLTFVFSNVTLSPDTDPWDLFHNMLAHFIHSLKGYYHITWVDRPQGRSDSGRDDCPSAALFMSYLQSAARHYPPVEHLVRELENADPQFKIDELDGQNPELDSSFMVKKRSSEVWQPSLGTVPQSGSSCPKLTPISEGFNFWAAGVNETDNKFFKMHALLHAG
ncbi:hypothetical protein NMY22_g14851 [Coprinellus aureogranulatus]|nr:hypothetical protein NMY22_g14851 [Coprinellus aureogranulatus]